MFIPNFIISLFYLDPNNFNYDYIIDFYNMDFIRLSYEKLISPGGVAMFGPGVII